MSPEEDGIRLTAREREVCLLVADLKSNTTIARELGISVRTVEKYLYAAARQLPGNLPPQKKIIRHFST